MNPRRLPVIRVAAELGHWKMSRLIFAIAIIAALAQTLVVFRPDLIRPTDLGSDTSNYFASAERLLAGQPLYALVPGDRPVPADNPPQWNAAILSPPSVPLLFAPFLAISAPFGMLLWWAICLAGMLVFLSYFARRAPPAALLLATPLTVVIAITAWSGNINALLPVLALFLWKSSEDQDASAGFQAAAGLLVAIGIAGKLGPIVFIPWLLGRRRWDALAWCAAGLLVIVAGVALTSGWSSVLSYLRVSANAVHHPTGISPIGLASAVGLPQAWADWLPEAMVVATSIFSLWGRSRPKGTFAVAAAVCMLASPTIRTETFGLLVACAIPWIAADVAGALPGRGRRALSTIGAFVALVLAAMGLSFFMATPSQSTVAIRNDAHGTRIVRFQVTAQYATFGYVLSPGAEGVAWPTIWGTVTQPVLVFDASCKLVDRVVLPSSGGTIELGDEGARIVPLQGGPALPFQSECADEHPT